MLLASPVPQSNAGYPSFHWELTEDELGNTYLVDLDPLEIEVEPHFDPDNDIILLLFTRSNPTVGQRVFINEASIRNSNMNPAHETRFTIHGWTSSQNDPVNIQVRNAYFQHGDYNVSQTERR